MSTSFERNCVKLIAELGLGSRNDLVSITPLAGGVSSDIGLVDLGHRKICVKFALEQLKVQEEWHAKRERNQAEYQWLQFVSKLIPEATPVLYGSSAEGYGFAMEFVEGDDVFLWKSSLLQSNPDGGEAGKVGEVLGRIHNGSAHSPVIRHEFQNQEDFHALRLEPYLSFTATKHPTQAALLQDLIVMVNSNQLVLVHGDVSPKNILFRNGHPIFLDAECATIGDPAFDISFCLNHLILKAVHLKNVRRDLLASVEKFWISYRCHINWEAASEVEQRVCRLLPALMLARIDGKSPVEYLSDLEQSMVRTLAFDLLLESKLSLNQITHYIETYLEKHS